MLNMPSDHNTHVKKIEDEWKLRFNIVQSDHSSLESLLSMRRVLLNIMKELLPEENKSFLEMEVSKSWVKSAEIARKYV